MRKRFFAAGRVEKYVCKNFDDPFVFCGNGSYWGFLQPQCEKCWRFRFRRPECWSVGNGFRLWHFLFFLRRICWICRTIRMELWGIRYLDRDWQCFNRQFAGMGGFRQAYPRYDKTF